MSDTENRTEHEAGHETVAHALLIAGIGVGVLSVAQLGQIVVHGLNGLMTAWGGAAG